MSELDRGVEHERRLQAWRDAKDRVDPIIEKHGLKEYRLNNGAFTGTSMTVVDQHIDHIIRVAEWFMGVDEGAD